MDTLVSLSNNLVLFVLIEKETGLAIPNGNAAPAISAS